MPTKQFTESQEVTALRPQAGQALRQYEDGSIIGRVKHVRQVRKVIRLDFK